MFHVKHRLYPPSMPICPWYACPYYHIIGDAIIMWVIAHIIVCGYLAICELMDIRSPCHPYSRISVATPSMPSPSYPSSYPCPPIRIDAIRIRHAIYLRCPPSISIISYRGGSVKIYGCGMGNKLLYL